MDYSSNVDTSRPFRSVKEAVAVFGERFLVGEIYTPKSFAFPKQETPFFAPSPKVEKEPQSNYSSPKGSFGYNHETTLSDTVKKLETELKETKIELNLLKEREIETEAALASLNAELHNNMSKLARAEAVGPTSRAPVREEGMGDIGAINVIREEEKKRDAYLSMEKKASQSLAQILSFGESEDLFVGKKKERKMMMVNKKKKKPIVPIIGDLFSRKNGSSKTMHNPLYASSHLEWN